MAYGLKKQFEGGFGLPHFFLVFSKSLFFISLIIKLYRLNQNANPITLKVILETVIISTPSAIVHSASYSASKA